MPPVTFPPASACPHDLGPGTTICLRCRQDLRDAARARQQRLFAVGGIALMGVLGLYVLGASATNALRAATRGDTVRVAPRASVVASSVSGGSEVKQQGESAPVTVVSATAVATGEAPSPMASPASRPPFAPIVREGRTILPDDLIAERGGDSVIVDFDTPSTRTRRRDKFEHVVRRTLPLVYGARVDSVLRTIPDGGIVGDAVLLTELPKRGVHLRVADGWALDVWPQTRAGQDGPLLVGYWARVTRVGALR